MPASLAIKLLKNYVHSLEAAPASKIIDDHVMELQAASVKGDLKGAIVLSVEFANERQLIDNIKNDKFDAYKVD